MLSVCIPVYNYKVENLLGNLAIQLVRSGIEHEIVIADDGSDPFYKQENELDALKFGVRVISLGKNVGRSAVRNLLCREAQFENLLFLDCDSVITSEDFISDYMPYLNKNMVVYGGTAYQNSKPGKKYRLHWNYGRRREVKPLSIRNMSPEKYFKTNNFLIPKAILGKYPFNEELKGYGHEDTLMGVVFSLNDISVFHIDNPVLHNGLETNHVFFMKTETAVRNLFFIPESYSRHYLDQFIGLLKAHSKFEDLNLIWFLRLVWLFSKPLQIFLIKNFYLLKVLDFYKLGLLSDINKKAPSR